MNNIFIILTSIFLVASCGIFSDVKKYNNPVEEYLILNGYIDEGLMYKAKVNYVTTSENKTCKNHNWIEGVYTPKTKNYKYLPKIDGTRHSIYIPLKELSPDTACAWKPRSIYICAGAADWNKDLSTCSAMFILSDYNNIMDNNFTLSCNKSRGRCFTLLHKAEINKEYWVTITVSKPNTALKTGLGKKRRAP